MNTVHAPTELPPWVQYWFSFRRWKMRLFIFLSIFGPATITAMADNDASGVATYAIAGAKLGYPILFVLFWVTIFLALTQEMGIRLSLVSRKGLGDLIREYHGVKAAIWIFLILFIANMGTIVADIAAFRVTAEIFRLPTIPVLFGLIIIVFFFVTAGSYKSTQNIMLVSSLFYLTYVFSAFKANPDWNLALGNLAWPQGISFSPQYWKSYIIVGLGVLGTTITPWGQFFISSFGLDKKIDPAKLKYSRLETYWGAFLTDFFSFFMIVATAATLFVNGIGITDGTKASMAIAPLAGKLAATLFALGIMNAGFMGIVIVGLSTTYAFSEFFGYSGGLDTRYQQSPAFYVLFLIQLLLGLLVVMIPSVNLFTIVIATQILNAVALPPIFYYLIKFTSHRDLMGEFTNTPVQKYGAAIGTIIISLASLFAVAATIFR